MTHNHNHSLDKPPHEDLFNSIGGFVVMSIIMNGLFAGIWWAALFQFFLAIDVIKKLIQYVENKESRNSYQYHRTSEDIVNAWIPAILVSIVLNILLHGYWFIQIPIALLNLNAIKTTYEYILTEKQKQEKSQNIQNGQNPQEVQYSGTISVSHPVQNQSESMTQQYVVVATSPQTGAVQGTRYCQVCGEPKLDEGKFCAACGYEFQ